MYKAITYEQTTQASSSGTSLTINKPTGATVGQTMVAVLIPPGGLVTPPTDWVNNRTGDILIYSKVVRSSEPSSYTWNVESASNWAGVILLYSGINLQRAIEKSLTGSGTSGSYNVPSITPDGLARLLLGIWVVGPANVVIEDAAPGMSARASTKTTEGYNWKSLNVDDEILDTADPSGTKTLTGDSKPWKTMALVLEPDTGTQQDFFTRARVSITPTVETETMPNKALWSVIADTGESLDDNTPPDGSTGFAVLQAKVEGSDIYGREAYLDITLDDAAALTFGKDVPIMAKTQFQSTEALFIAFPPFINKFTGEQITTGSETITLTLSPPTGDPITAAMTWNSVVNMWHATVSTASYVAGSWTWKATSDTVNTDEKYGVITWGDYVEGLSADVPLQVAALYKIGTGRWKVDQSAKTLTLYDPDSGDPLYVFDLKDASGNPSAISIFERTPSLP